MARKSSRCRNRSWLRFGIIVINKSEIHRRTERKKDNDVISSIFGLGYSRLRYKYRRQRWESLHGDGRAQAKFTPIRGTRRFKIESRDFERPYLSWWNGNRGNEKQNSSNGKVKPQLPEQNCFQ